MKTKLLSIMCCMLITCYAVNSNGQTNRQLSNLISPTAVNVDLLPGGTTGTKNLGSDTKRWRNGYFNGTVYCYGAGFGVYTQGGFYGVYGNGSSYGVYGSSSSTGVFGYGDHYGVYGSGSLAGIIGFGRGWAGYFSGKVYSSGGYTTSDQKL